MYLVLSLAVMIQDSIPMSIGLINWLMTYLDLDIRTVVWVEPGSGDTGLCTNVDQLDNLTYDSPWPWHQKCSLSWAWPWWHRTLCQCRSAWWIRFQIHKLNNQFKTEILCISERYGMHFLKVCAKKNNSVSRQIRIYLTVNKDPDQGPVHNNNLHTGIKVSPFSWKSLKVVSNEKEDVSRANQALNMVTLWYFRPVFRIRGSALLTNGSGSCSFRQWPSRSQKKLLFKKYFCLLPIFLM